MSEVYLSGCLTGASVLQAVSAVPLRNPPPQIIFDFTKVSFTEPSGIVLMHNLTRYLVRHNRQVGYRGHATPGQAQRFLDSIGFFEDQLGSKVWPTSRLKSTTCRLQEVQQVESVGWIDNYFLHWFSNCSHRPVSALSGLRNCLIEIFNNIRDHSTVSLGSIFAQWYPNIQELKISIGDFGQGIPASVASRTPGLQPAEAIVQAFREGYSSQTTPRNRGAGLEVLRNTITQVFGGTLIVYSGGAAVSCYQDGVVRPANVWLGNSGYTGTLLEVTVPTNRIAALAPQQEDDIW